MDKAQSYFVSLTSMSVAGVCTAPFDTIKTRLQMQQGAQRGFLAMGVHIVRTESARGLFKGVTPMLGRALTHGALRMSLYTPAKSVLCGALGSPDERQPPVAVKIAAGAASGAFAALVSNPLELLKVRTQTETARVSPVAVFSELVRREGMASLWKGVTASMQRSALLNIGQLTVYDQIKQTLRALDMESSSSQTASSVLAGIVTATITNPVDVIKTRIMNQNASSSPLYRGSFHALQRIVREEGVRALFKGWLPNFSRQGPQTVIMLFCAESLRRALDMPPV